MKSQASQLTYKNDFINSFFLPSAEEALTDIYDQDKKINRLLDQTKPKKPETIFAYCHSPTTTTTQTTKQP